MAIGIYETTIWPALESVEGDQSRLQNRRQLNGARSANLIQLSSEPAFGRRTSCVISDLTAVSRSSTNLCSKSQDTVLKNDTSQQVLRPPRRAQDDSSKEKYSKVSVW